MTTMSAIYDKLGLPNDKPWNLLVCGSCGSGKSVLISFICYEAAKRKLFDYVVVFSSTAGLDDNYSWAPTIYSQCDDTSLNAIMEKQKKDPSKRCLVVLDDCLNFHLNSRIVTKFISTFRHYKISYIIATQYLYKIPSTIRANIFNAAVFKTVQRNSIQSVIDSYACEFRNVEKFKEYLQRSTGDYKFLWIKMNVPDDAKYTTAKVSPPPKFKLKQ